LKLLSEDLRCTSNTTNSRTSILIVVNNDNDNDTDVVQEEERDRCTKNNGNLYLWFFTS